MRWLHRAVIFYSLTLLTATLFALQPLRALLGLKEILAFATLYWILGLVETAGGLRRLVDAVLLLGIGQTLVAFIFGYLGTIFSLGDRPRGTLSHYMTFSGILLVAVLFLGARLAVGRVRQRWVAVIGLLILLGGLMVSYTRSAWLGLVVGGLVLLWIHAKRTFLIGVPLVFLAFILLAPPSVKDRMWSIFDPEQPANHDRLCMAESALEMVQDFPLTGLGPTLVREYYPAYRHQGATRFNVPHLHNSYLQVAAERGLPGLLAYLFLLGVCLGRGLWLWHQEGGRNGPRADLLLGSLTVILGFLVVGLFEDNWSDTEVQRLVFLAMAIPFTLKQLPGETLATTVEGE